MSTIRIPLPPHRYRFDLLLEFVRRIAYPARMIVRDNRLWRVTAGQLVSYRQEGDAIVIGGRLDAAVDDNLVRETSKRVLGINHDLSAFYDFAAADGSLWPVIEPVAGFPLACTETVFEALITLIIEQHITWKNALRGQQTLARILATETATSDNCVYDFASPGALASLRRDDLKPLKITDGRIDLIIRLAQEVVSGELDLEGIASMDAQSAYQFLLSIKGVGHWTAANVLGRALGRYPYVSHNDVALQAAICHYFDIDRRLKSAQLVNDTLLPYGEYAGLTGHFLLLRWVLDRYPVAH